MPAMAICTDLRLKFSIVCPGIWNDLTTSVTARMAAFGARSNAAPSRLR